MLLFVTTFQDGFVQYNITYETTVGYYLIEEIGQEYSSNTKSLPGTLFSAPCVGLDQYQFYAQNDYPYANLVINNNSPYCGYNPSNPGTPLSVIPTATNETKYHANDGKVDLNITGGTGPYLYAFNNGSNFTPYTGQITGLAPGNYGVTIQDQNGIQTTSTFSIIAVDPVYGCIDKTAINYDPNAQIDNGTCVYPNVDEADNRQNIYENVDQFRLINKDGEVFLVEMPGGWEEIVFQLKRDPKYHGVNYEFSDGTIQLDFDVDAGKELLDAEYALNGNDGYMRFLFGEVSADGTFTPDIDAFIDFNTKYSDRDKFSASVKTKRFNDAIETKNEVDVTIKDGYFNMPLHSKEIRKQTVINRTYKSSQLDSLGNSIFGDPNPNAPAPGDAPFMVYWNFLDFSQPAESESGYSSYINDLIPNPPLFGTTQSNPQPTSQYLFIADGSGDFTFNIAFSLKFITKVLAPVINDSRTGYWSYKWFLVIANNTYELPGTQSGFTNSRFNNIDFTTSYNQVHHLNQGDRVFLYGQYVFEKINTPGGFEGTIQLNYMNVNIAGNTLAAPTTSLSKLAYELVQDILTDISAGQAILKSNLLGRTDIGYAEDGCAALLAYTNGYLIRGFPIEKRPLIAQLKDIIEGIDANYCIGMGYELNEQNQWVWRLEQSAYFYRDELIFVFDNVSDYKEEIDTSLIYNELSFGYEKYTQELESVSTLDEFLTKHGYLTAIESYKGKLERICKQIAGGYPIELTRRKQYGSDPNVSWTYDEDNFIISTVRDAQYGYIPEKLENFTASGILSPETAYNIRLSVTRMVERWSGFINSSLAYKTLSSLIKNTFTAKNGDLTSQYTGTQPCESKVQLTEANDLLKGDLDNGKQLFFPEKITFKTKLSWIKVREIRRCFVNKDTLNRNNGYFGVVDGNGNTNYGFLTSMEYNPLSEEVTFVLRKKYVDLNEPFDCSEYTFYTFADFEAATGLPKEIEQCQFENFA